MKICLSIDLEQDCPPYFETYRGMEEGFPKFLGLLATEKIPATCFATGQVAERYPDLMARLVREQHELGCHGHTHRRFDQIDTQEASFEIKTSSKILRHFASVISFRAPNLEFPSRYLPILFEEGYKIDSSLARYKLDYFLDRSSDFAIKRFPVSVTSSALRLPTWLKNIWFWTFSLPVILFVHPWEFVDWTKTNLRWDCRWGTGEPALESLKETIHFFKKRGFQFLRMRDL